MECQISKYLHGGHAGLGGGDLGEDGAESFYGHDV